MLRSMGVIDKKNTHVSLTRVPVVLSGVGHDSILPSSLFKITGNYTSRVHLFSLGKSKVQS